MWYRLFRALARLTLRLFFRQIEVEAAQNVPPLGPVLLVPNHTNALVDPLVLLTAIDRRLTVTAKNVLARNPLLGWLMRSLGVIAFHRREDVGKGADLRQNVRSLQRCREVLAGHHPEDGRGVICIFPEGVSHSDPKLRRFQVGPARIALDYLRKDGNPGRLRIVPVGLLYTEKDQFRSGVWLRFGEPIDVARWCEEHPGAGADALTEELRRRVEALTINYESRRESLILTWAGQIVATGGHAPPPLGAAERPVAEWFRLVARLQSGYHALVESDPAAVEELSTRIRRYRTELKRGGIEPQEVYLPLHPGRALFFLVRELELVVVGAPLALFGVINHVLPYLVVKQIARRLSRDKDHWASNVVYPSFVVFPFFYLLQLAAAWLALAAFWAALYTVALFYTGYYALLYGDRLTRTFRRTRTFLRFLFRRADQQRLAAEGREIVGRIRELGDRLEAGRTESPERGGASQGPAAARHGADLELQFREDCATLRELAAGLDRLEATWQDARKSVRARTRGYFTPEEDDRVRQMLLAYRNYRLVLYELIERYLGCRTLENESDRIRGFMIGYAAGLMLYAKSMKLIQTYEHDPLVRNKLNEPDAKFGIRAGFFEEILRAYTSLYNYRLLAASGRFWYRRRRAARRLGLDAQGDYRSLAEVIHRHRFAARKTFWYLVRHRLRYDWRALWRSLFRPLYNARYSMRAFVVGTFAEMHTTSRYQPAIDEPTLAQLRTVLQPGDVLQVRAERKITTAILPGFWKHSAMYVGGRSDLERLGISGHPHVQEHWDRIPEEGGRLGYVLEAISAGVVASPLEKCLHADDVMVLRPNVSEAERQSAIVEAFSHLGKPYDFEFDFNVTTRLVCTELIYRSYHGKGAIEFPLTKRLGRFTLTCDDITHWFLKCTDAIEDARKAPFQVVSLVLQVLDGKAHFVLPAAILDVLRSIQEGLKPSAAVHRQLVVA
jgi:glycerol-3-phosphate O-acyltransferase/dihydroxyacetone phosphate acyltransferase